ncbi:HAD family hydrolase [Spirosoma sp. BT702]|uniref:HAD family hydrolase n=1 Tax=Spirosoma profusum TaxID=2771354 RepID=A0A926Y127_9BACT|nr:HAD hydrolase-like protein [Spirosoma profusum]MBD2699831.1 HAD family hydrolase [Spirosoma profusum]
MAHVGRHKPLIIFDLDDTLVDTSELYWQAKTVFIALLHKYGFSEEYIENYFEQQDTANMVTLGFHPSRYGKTMKDVYANLIKAGKVKHPQLLQDIITEIGELVVKGVPELIEGAVNMLKTLQTDYRLTLITRGVEEVQFRKIYTHKLNIYFKDIRVVSRKDTELFRNYIYEFGSTPETTWIVGDSIRSEINPGLEINAKCIHYIYKHVHYTWTQEHNMKINKSNYYKCNSLSEVASIIRLHDNVTNQSQIKQKTQSVYKRLEGHPIYISRK